jgi:peptidyl-tRNA hydrolase, PTH1 family
MDNSFLIVGLGNPGRQYARNRHNAGFMLVERLAERWRANWITEGKFYARLAHVRRDDRNLLLCQPGTFMNASGEAVGLVADYYRVPLDRILVAVDDADLPCGHLRMRPSGSSGGHHGLESVQQHLGTTGYARLRIGIGRDDGQTRQIAGHVLSDFSASEADVMEKALTRACEQVECWLFEGVAQAMNRFNGPPTV